MTASTKPPYWEAATEHLRDADPTLAGLIAAFPGIHLTRRSDPFTTLSRAIVGQQISVKAAQSIWDRFAAAAGGTGSPVRLDPARVARMRLPALTAVGLSGRKAEYLRDLARHFKDGSLDPAQWPALSDEALIEALVDVKGIGRWTAEMFLIFHELRPDVFPLDDIGLQKAIARHYFAGRRRARRTLERLGRRWQPYRSVATWYLWRSLDPIPVEY
jgi:DNA-3-methyladenine glycosylase II